MRIKNVGRQSWFSQAVGIGAWTFLALGLGFGFWLLFREPQWLEIGSQKLRVDGGGFMSGGLCIVGGLVLWAALLGLARLLDLAEWHGNLARDFRDEWKRTQPPPDA